MLTTFTTWKVVGRYTGSCQTRISARKIKIDTKKKKKVLNFKIIKQYLICQFDLTIIPGSPFHVLLYSSNVVPLAQSTVAEW